MQYMLGEVTEIGSWKVKYIIKCMQFIIWSVFLSESDRRDDRKYLYRRNKATAFYKLSSLQIRGLSF